MPLPTEVVVHPLVLLSAVDHYNRAAKDKRGARAIGVLLGSTFQGKCDVTNSFAVPFEEDTRNPQVWYLDHSFLEKMERMFRKINAKEKVVGFYSTGPKLRAADLDIDELFHKFCPHPVLVIIDVRADAVGLPTKAYGSTEEIEQSTKTIRRTFQHIDSSVGAFEAEEVGVEHLLRDINDPTVSHLAKKIRAKMTALGGLQGHLEEMGAYLQHVLDGKLPVNNQVIYNIQTIFNLLPNVNVEALVRAMFAKSNDFYMVIYLSALIRSVIALHNLVNNKIKYGSAGGEADDDEEETEVEKGKEAKDVKEGDKAKDGEKEKAKK